jgi:hypothetical protein
MRAYLAIPDTHLLFIFTDLPGCPQTNFVCAVQRTIRGIWTLIMKPTWLSRDLRTFVEFLEVLVFSKVLVITFLLLLNVGANPL